MLPKVDYKNFRRGKGEQSRFAFKVLKRCRLALVLEFIALVITHLVFATLATVRSLDVHHENVCFPGTTHPDSCAHVGDHIKSSQRPYIPLVVCCLFVSSMTSKVVPKSRLSNVPEMRISLRKCTLSRTSQTFASRL